MSLSCAKQCFRGSAESRSRPVVVDARYLTQLVKCLHCKHKDLCLIPKPLVTNRKSQAWWYTLVISGLGRWVDGTGSSSPMREHPPKRCMVPKKWVTAEVGLWGCIHVHTRNMGSEGRKDGRHEKGHARLNNLETVDGLLIHPLKWHWYKVNKKKSQSNRKMA